MTLIKMNPLIAISLILSLFCGHIFSEDISEVKLLSKLATYVKKDVLNEDTISEKRKKTLSKIAQSILTRLKEGKEAKLTFICTHNSRRSHMSQIWAQTAAYYYNLDKVTTYSGGTEVTACNCRTVTSMRRAGFSISDATEEENPLYLVKYAENRPPIQVYSKLYNIDSNPKKGFIALMTCSSADKTCPTVKGAVARFPIHYMDPRLCDDTPRETAAYNERCQEIAREMFYIMSVVNKNLDKVDGLQ